jgi:hypothetical protein
MFGSLFCVDRVDLEMQAVGVSDALMVNFCVALLHDRSALLHACFVVVSGKAKARTLRVRAFVDRSFVGGLRDDLGSLQKDRDGDRSKQDEGGGEAGDLGHWYFPLRFSVCFVGS